jgi:hypothetical protein
MTVRAWMGSWQSGKPTVSDYDAVVLDGGSPGELSAPPVGVS